MSIKKSDTPATPNFFPWFIWILGATFYFYKYLLEVSPSVMGMELMQAFHINGAELGNLAAFYFYAYLIMQIPMGILLDRFGPRRVTSICIFLCAAGTLLLAQSTHLWSAELGRFITGVGASVAALSVFKLTTLWFPSKRFALMAGLMMTAGMLGAVSGQAPLSAAMEVFGWHHTLIYAAFIGFGLMVLFWVMVRDNGPYLIEHGISTQDPNKIWKGIIEVLKKPQTWILSLYSGLAFAPVAVFGGLWGVPYLQAAHHFSRTLAAESVSLIFIGFAVGGPLFGWYSDRLGKRLPLMIWGTLGSLVTLTIVLYFPNLSVLFASFLLFIFGFCISSFLVCFSMIREINRLIFAATALGFMNAFNALLGALSDPLIGYLLDLGWDGKKENGAMVFSLQDYHYAMLMLPAFLIVALLLIPFIKETYCKQYVEVKNN